MGSSPTTPTSFSDPRAAGTFTFTTEPVPSTGTTGTKGVTDPKFDVTF